MADLNPRVRPVSRAVLRDLADVDPADGVILSVYLDLDPTHFATARARDSQVTSLLDDAVAIIEQGDHGHDVQAALQRDVERARTYLRAPDADGAGAIAVFCCDAAGLFDVVRIPRPVPREVVVGPSAHLGPLARYATVEDWCVALVNRKITRIFRGTSDALREIHELEDVLHRQHAKGGWSQARMERSVEQDVANHLDHTNEALLTMLQQAPYDNLLIGTTQELWPDVTAALHDYVRRRLRGRIDVDVEHTNADDVLTIALPAIDAEERRQEDEILARLAEELGQGARAAATAPEVRRALDAHKVDTLILDDQSREVDDLVDLALRQDSQVRIVHDPDRLAPYDHVAALLRY